MSHDSQAFAPAPSAIRVLPDPLELELAGVLPVQEVETARRAFSDAVDPTAAWINVLAQLVSTGTSYEEASELLGKPMSSIQIVTSTSRFQSLLIQIAKAKGTDAYKDFIGGQIMASFVKIVEIRDNPALKPETRMNAALTILQYAIGKPQAIDKATRNNAPDGLGAGSDDPVEVAKALDDKIKRLTPKQLH